MIRVGWLNSNGRRICRSRGEGMADSQIQSVIKLQPEGSRAGAAPSAQLESYVLPKRSRSRSIRKHRGVANPFSAMKRSGPGRTCQSAFAAGSRNRKSLLVVCSPDANAANGSKRKSRLYEARKGGASSVVVGGEPTPRREALQGERGCRALALPLDTDGTTAPSRPIRFGSTAAKASADRQKSSFVSSASPRLQSLMTSIRAGKPSARRLVAPGDCGCVGLFSRVLASGAGWIAYQNNWRPKTTAIVVQAQSRLLTKRPPSA